jgi:hypothetical protein
VLDAAHEKVFHLLVVDLEVAHDHLKLDTRLRSTALSTDLVEKLSHYLVNDAFLYLVLRPHHGVRLACSCRAICKHCSILTRNNCWSNLSQRLPKNVILCGLLTEHTIEHILVLSLKPALVALCSTL